MPGQALEIRGGTLIRGNGAAPLANATLRIVDGRIATVWSGEARPRDADPAGSVYDATGTTVMPGLIDAHCHISYGEARSAEEVDIYGGAEWNAVRAVWNAGKVLQAGVTGICDCGSTWNTAVTVRDAIANGMFPGPRMLAAGRHIVADGGFADYFPGWLGMPASAEGVLCTTADEMAREVRQQVKNRVDLVKVSGDSQAQESRMDVGSCFSDDELELIVKTAKRLGRKLTIHARYAETVLAAARAGFDWLIHASYMRPGDIGFICDSRIPICPTLTFTANIVEWGREAGVDPNYVGTKKRELDALADIHSRAHKAGIPLMVGSESGFSVTPYGEWHARELELMVELLGLSPMEAIVASTRTNAEVLGWGAETGTLEPGRLADILIVDGDPLADISVLGKPERIRAVFKAGVPVTRTEPAGPRRRMSHERGFHVSAQILNRTQVR
ncbi:MAG TPA: amidohydrolase family protein [Burkholderiales bacterium]|nr:amidohydrolase family protein [Burkholderiales bacterium]